MIRVRVRSTGLKFETHDIETEDPFGLIQALMRQQHTSVIVHDPEDDPVATGNPHFEFEVYDGYRE